MWLTAGHTVQSETMFNMKLIVIHEFNPKGIFLPSFLLSKYFQHILKLKLFYTVSILYSLCIKHKIFTLIEDFSIIYKATTTIVNVLLTPSAEYCLALDPELIIFMALKVHVRGL